MCIQQTDMHKEVRYCLALAHGKLLMSSGGDDNNDDDDLTRPLENKTTLS